MVHRRVMRTTQTAVASGLGPWCSRGSTLTRVSVSPPPPPLPNNVGHLPEFAGPNNSCSLEPARSVGVAEPHSPLPPAHPSKTFASSQLSLH